MLLNLNEVFKKPQAMELYIHDLHTFTSDWEKRKLELDMVDGYLSYHKVLKPIDVAYLVDKSRHEPPFFCKYKQRMWEWNSIQMCN